MTCNRCHQSGCNAFYDDRSGALELCLEHLLAHLWGKIAELERTREVLVERIFEQNRLMAEAVVEGRG